MVLNKYHDTVMNCFPFPVTFQNLVFPNINCFPTRKLQISKQLPLRYTPPEVTGNDCVDTAQILSSWGSGLPLPRQGALIPWLRQGWTALCWSLQWVICLQLGSRTKLHKAGLTLTHSAALSKALLWNSMSGLSRFGASVGLDRLNQRQIKQGERLWSNPLPLSSVTYRAPQAKQFKHTPECFPEQSCIILVVKNSWGHQMLFFVSLVDGNAVK